MTKDDEEKSISQQEILARLSPADRERYLFDWYAYGNAMVEVIDGVYRYVPLTDERARELLMKTKA